MLKKREFAKFLKDSGIKKIAIAKKLGMTRQGLEYHLKGDEEVDAEIYNKTLKIINEIKEPNQKYSADNNLNKKLEEQSDIIKVLADQVDYLRKENIKLQAEKISLIQINQELERKVKKINRG